MPNTELRRMPLDQSSLTRNAGEPGQADTMSKTIVSPQGHHFRSKNVIGKKQRKQKVECYLHGILFSPDLLELWGYRN